jgi:charged multivesicular body protein 2A
MGNIMGEQKSSKELIQEQQRALTRSIRALERERAGLERQEKKLQGDIKKAAKLNQMKSVKIMAKDLIRLRKHNEKFLGLVSQLNAISLQMTTMSSTQTLATSMKQVTKSMGRLNNQIKLPELQKVMMEFQKQSEKMEMQGEMVGEAVDDAMNAEEDEEESEQVVNQVLDELNINLSEQMVDAPSKKEKKVKEESKEENELENRLKNLNNS